MNITTNIMMISSGTGAILPLKRLTFDRKRFLSFGSLSAEGTAFFNDFFNTLSNPQSPDTDLALAHTLIAPWLSLLAECPPNPDNISRLETLLPFALTHSPQAIEGALIDAISHGQMPQVTLLAPHQDLQHRHSYYLFVAVQFGQLEVATFLLPLSDPKALNSYALATAFRDLSPNSLSLAKLLFPHRHPDMNLVSTLGLLFKNNHRDLFDLALTHYDPLHPADQMAVTSILDHLPPEKQTAFREATAIYFSGFERATLHEATQTVAPSTARSTRAPDLRPIKPKLSL